MSGILLATILELEKKKENQYSCPNFKGRYAYPDKLS